MQSVGEFCIDINATKLYDTDIMDYLKKAEYIFAKTKYKATDEDIKRLANNMVLLEARGLCDINQRLINDNKSRNIWATIAEHNFAVLLVSQHPLVPILYEPDELKRPPDFKVTIENIVYWIQMKDLSKLERENRLDKKIEKIKTAAKKIKVEKFFSCMLSDDFNENCLNELLEFIREKATTAAEKESFFFTCKNKHKAKIEFWSANKIELSELTLGISGDLEMMNLTGLDKEQIKNSLLKTVGAFEWNVDQKNINLIAMEADGKEDIDICGALFGTETECYYSSSQRNFWSRENDGLFKEPGFSQKVAGVIAMKRKKHFDNNLSESDIIEIARRFGMDPAEYCKQLQATGYLKPISDYHMILYLNEELKHLLEDIKRLLPFDNVIYYNVRPPMGQGNF